MKSLHPLWHGSTLFGNIAKIKDLVFRNDRGMVVVAVALITVAVSLAGFMVKNIPGFVSWFGEKTFGPLIIVSALPSNRFPSKTGKQNILTQYEIHKYNPISITDSKINLRKLQLHNPIPILEFKCKKPKPVLNSFNSDDKHHFFLLTIIFENKGGSWPHLEAEYTVGITFNTFTKSVGDPHIRIVAIQSDGRLTTDYFYTQRPDLKPPRCVKWQKFPGPAQSPLVLEGYRRAGLTREFVELRGKVESHSSQTVNLLLRIPPHVNNKFIVLYHIYCPKCRRGFHMQDQWFAQTILVDSFPDSE